MFSTTFVPRKSLQGYRIVNDNKLTVLSFVILSLFPTILFGQHQHGPALPSKGKSILFSGVGARKHPVSTKNALAQKFFNQGLAFVYAFNHDEAVSSFQYAADLDPALAMAYWGVALASGPNYNIPEIDVVAMKRASDAVQKAISLSANATEKERAYIAALSKRFSNDPLPDHKQLARDYSNAMRKVYLAHPGDLDAATLYAESMMNLRPWKLWSNDGKPAEGTLEIINVLESILKQDPKHVGANHFYIHVLEASPHPDRALASAKRIGALAPLAGHLVHMASHIYMRTGDYHAAAKSNADAVEADRKHMAKAGTQGLYPAMYYTHNLHFLAAAHMMEGKFTDSMRAAKQLRDHAARYAREYPLMDAMAGFRILVLVRFGQWDEILKMQKPSIELPIHIAFWRFAQGIALASKHRIPEAEESLRLVALFVTAAPPDSMIGLNKTTDILKINEYVLAGRIASAKEDHSGAAEHFQRAVELQDRLNYDEPLGYYYPVRESLGSALLLSGEAKAAENVFRKDLQINRRNGRSLFGLMHSLKAQNNLVAAQEVERQFQMAWEFADSKLRIEEL